MAPRFCFGGVFSLPTVMLSLVDQLLVTSPLLRRKLGIDLGTHARLDGIEARPHACPQGIGLGAVPRDDRPDGVPLRGVEIQLPAQVGDEGVRAAARAAVVTCHSFAATPSGKPTRHEHRSQEADGGEFRSIQHGSSCSLFLALVDE